MLYGIIADIHANLEALQPVLAALQEVDQIICLGDIVGYGPEPNECLELIKSHKIISIAGNHDKAASGKKEMTNFNQNAQAAVVWTSAQLSDENKRFLDGLQLTMTFPGFQFVHGSLRFPLDEYIRTLDEALICFEQMTESLVFVGHTHRPIMAYKTELGINGRGLLPDQPVNIKDFRKCLINVGSVGQPRDGDPRASFGIFDQATGQFTLRRVLYNIAAVQAKMRQKALPEKLIERLAVGK